MSFLGPLPQEMIKSTKPRLFSQTAGRGVSVTKPTNHPIKMSSVIVDQENPEGLDSALRVLASLMVRKYISEKKRLESESGSTQPAERKDEAPIRRRLLDVDGLSSYLSLPKATIYTWVSLRKIPERAIIRLGRTLRFDLKEIDAWVEQQKR